MSWHRTSAIVGSLLAASCNGRPILHASHDPIETSAERLVIPAEGRFFRTRDIALFKQTFGLPCGAQDIHVVAFGGNGSRAEQLAPAVGSLLEPWSADSCAVHVWALRYPGFGEDRERASARAAGSAAEQAYRFVRGQAKGSAVGVYGHSLGGSLALHMAARADPRPDALIVDRAPSIPRLILGYMGWWNLWLGALPFTATLPRALWTGTSAHKSKTVPAVFVIGSEDRTIPVRNARAAAKAYRGPKRIVSVAVDHNDRISPSPQSPLGRELAWLGQKLMRDAPSPTGAASVDLRGGHLGAGVLGVDREARKP